jgi:hypothetical protein
VRSAGPNKKAAVARLGIAVGVERVDQLECVGHGLAQVASALVAVAQEARELIPGEKLRGSTLGLLERELLQGEEPVQVDRHARPTPRELELNALVEGCRRGPAEVEVVETEPKVWVGRAVLVGLLGVPEGSLPRD